MRLSQRAEYSMASLREIFTFVASLGLVNGIKQVLTNGDKIAFVDFQPAPIHCASLLAFVAIVIRYYHGNCLHLLQNYSRAGAIDTLSRRLPADFFFIFCEGVTLALLSFYIKNAYSFQLGLWALFAVDLVWLMSSVVMSHRDNHYQRTWLLINLGAIFILSLVIVFGKNISESPRWAIVVCVAGLHTLADYFFCWPWYFEIEERRSVMVGAPFTKKLINGLWSDSDLEKCIRHIYGLADSGGWAKPYSGHIIEEFGRKLRLAKDFVESDVDAAHEASWFIGIWDGTESVGLTVEISTAAVYGAKIVLCLKDGVQEPIFLTELVQLHKGDVIHYKDCLDLVSQLAAKMKIAVPPNLV